MRPHPAIFSTTEPLFSTAQNTHTIAVAAFIPSLTSCFVGSASCLSLNVTAYAAAAAAAALTVGSTPPAYQIS